MIRCFRSVVLHLFIGLSGLSGLGLLHLSAVAETNRFRIEWVRLSGTINPASASFLKASVARAEREGSQAVLVELNTPGGLVSSVRDMAQSIDQSKVPVIVYVYPAGAAATSAGAVLALSSHLAAMAPGTNLGAAHPVGSQGDEIKGVAGEKATNDVAALARSLADLRGRNSDAAEQIVRKSRSFTSQEALNQKLIEVIADSREELLKKIDGSAVMIGKEKRILRTAEAALIPSEMTLGQRILHWLADPSIATLLFSLGMLLIYVEVSHPGISIAGTLGVICLIAGFVAFQSLPIQTGGLFLLVLGVLMLIAEPFVISHGALAVGGLIAMSLGFLWVIDPSEKALRIPPSLWLPLVALLGISTGLLGYAASRTRRLTREARAKIGGGEEQSAGLSGYLGHVQSVGDHGLSGKVLIRGETWDFVSSESMQVNQEVEVVRVEGFKAHVIPKR